MMEGLDYIVEREQEWNIVVLRDAVDRIKSKPLTKEQEERVKKIIRSMGLEI